MIEKFVASRRVHTGFLPPPKKPHYQMIRGVVQTEFAEAARRDAICKKFGADCTYKEGDTVIPWSPEEEEKLGDCLVSYIADTYSRYGKHNDWPKDDQPKIVTVWSKKLQCSYLCTPTYLKKKGT